MLKEWHDASSKSSERTGTGTGNVGQIASENNHLRSGSVFAPVRNEWAYLASPHMADDGLQRVLRSWCTEPDSGPTSRTNATTTTPASSSSAIPDVYSTPLHTKRYRPVPSVAECMAISQDGQYLAVAYHHDNGDAGYYVLDDYSDSDGLDKSNTDAGSSSDSDIEDKDNSRQNAVGVTTLGKNGANAEKSMEHFTGVVMLDLQMLI